jgi:hypothetical protein
LVSRPRSPTVRVKDQETEKSAKAQQRDVEQHKAIGHVKNIVFWYVELGNLIEATDFWRNEQPISCCCQLQYNRLFDLLFGHENGGNIFLQSICKPVSDYPASHPRGEYCSLSPNPKLSIVTEYDPLLGKGR